MFVEYDENDEQSSNQMFEREKQQQRHLLELEHGRAVRLMINGDPFFTGRFFLIHQKKYPIFDVFLDDVSQGLNANFGAVRHIYTPRYGRRLKRISDFEDHCTYVAAGNERFKRLK
jgi:Doublecortin